RAGAAFTNLECHSKTLAYSKKLVTSASPLRLNVGRNSWRENRDRLTSFETIENRDSLGFVRRRSLNRSRPEYIGVECSTSNRFEMLSLPLDTQTTSISLST